MEQLLIKAVTAENLDRLLPLMVDYQHFYQVPVIDPDRNRHFFAQFTRKPEEGIQHLALLDGEVAGFSTLYFSYCSLKAAAVGILYDLYVIPDRRHQGIGRALVEHAAGVSRKHGMQQMVWYTDPDNREARALYEDIGAEASQWVQYTLDLGGRPGVSRPV